MILLPREAGAQREGRGVSRPGPRPTLVGVKVPEREQQEQREGDRNEADGGPA